MRYVLVAIAMALLPKCLVCVAGYVVLVTGIAATPELCGVTGGRTLSSWEQIASVMVIGGAAFWLVSKTRTRVSGNDGVKR
ncbi:MAG TPA: hypothetical protein VIM71_15260 [Lacunisphaera sp.]